MAIKINEYEEKVFTPLTNGWYECFVSAVDKTEFDPAKGANKSSINYKVRDDIHPEFAGAEIRYDYISDADNMAWKVNALSKAIGIPVGTEFDSLDEFLGFIKMKPLKVNVKMEASTKDPEKIFARATSLKPTEAFDFVPPVADEDDEDLPF